MKIEGYCVKLGEEIIPGVVISKDCKFDMRFMNSTVSRDYRRNTSPLAEINSVKKDNKGLKISATWIETPRLKWWHKFINWVRKLFRYPALYHENNTIYDLIKGLKTDTLKFGIGFTVKEQDGNIIKRVDLKEVSIISNYKK